MESVVTMWGKEWGEKGKLKISRLDPGADCVWLGPPSFLGARKIPMMDGALLWNAGKSACWKSDYLKDFVIF